MKASEILEKPLPLAGQSPRPLTRTEAKNILRAGHYVYADDYISHDGMILEKAKNHSWNWAGGLEVKP